MSKELRVHDGTWDEEGADLIDPLSSNDQYVSRQRVTLGIDTEMLVKGIDGEILWPHLQGFPQERAPLNTETGNSGAFDFHADGFATELCIEATTCLDNLLANAATAFFWLNRKYLPNYLHKNPAIRICAPPVYKVPKAVVEEAPNEVKRLGCMPSVNIYGDSGTPGSLGPTTRTTGCHLHMSHDSLKNPYTAMALVRWADVLVGCTWTYISPESSRSEAQRRTAYGRAGEYRMKTYPNLSKGVEYRVLPGTPAQHPAYLTLMFNLYRSALRLAIAYGEPQSELSAQAQAAINNADKKMAKTVLRSLPISPNGRKLIRFMGRKALPSLNACSWASRGYDYKGHAYLYAAHVSEIKKMSALL